MHLTEQSILKKTLKTASKSTHKPSHVQYLFELCPHAQADQAWHTKKTPIFAPTAGARSSISPKLCLLIENVVTILKGVNQFSTVDPTHSYRQDAASQKSGFSPRMGDSLHRFTSRGFYTPNYPTLAFQISYDSHHRLRSYCWETARPSIRPNFFRPPCRKNYALDRKEIIPFWWPRRALSSCKVWGRS